MKEGAGMKQPLPCTSFPCCHQPAEALLKRGFAQAKHLVSTLGSAAAQGGEKGHLPGDGKEPCEQGDELEDLLLEVSGQHSHVEEVEDEEVDGLGDVSAVDLHLLL